MDNTQFDVPQATPLPVNSIYTVNPVGIGNVIAMCLRNREAKAAEQSMLSGRLLRGLFGLVPSAPILHCVDDRPQRPPGIRQ